MLLDLRRLCRTGGCAALLTVAAAAGARAQSPLPDSVRTRIDRVFARWDHTNTPGCALAISQRGAVVYERGYGMADLQHALAITPQSIFHVASISKQFAAYAVALLESDGKLSLDDDVRKHVPEVPDLGYRITIRQLIHHTSGLRDQWQLLSYAGWRFPDDLITEDDVLRIVARQKGLNFRPGDEWVYSNTGYTLLAVIVQRVTGQTLRAFAHDRIFVPLGMTQTHFHDDHTMIVPGRTSAYEPRMGGGWRISIPVFDTYGATSLFTTAADLLKWTANLDAPKVGSAALVAAAQKSAVLNDGSPAFYGYGMTVGTYRGLDAIGHGGADAGYRAHLERYPARQLAVAVLCNVSIAGPNVLLREVVDILLGDGAPPNAVSIDTVPRQVPPARLARWVGTYRDTISQQVIRVQLAGDTLRLADGRRLIPTSDSSARVANAPTGFVLRSANDVVQSIVQLPRGTRDAVYVRQVTPPPAASELAAFTGRYYSDELDVTYVVSAVGPNLRIEHRKLRNSPVLTAVFADGFTTNTGGTVLFTRDRSRRIDGFTLTDGRVRGVRFVREGTTARR